MNTLRQFIKEHYNSNFRMAESLEVTPQTVGTWVTKNPRGALKYLPEITSKCQVSTQYFVNIISCTEDELTKTN